MRCSNRLHQGTRLSSVDAVKGPAKPGISAPSARLTMWPQTHSSGGCSNLCTACTMRKAEVFRQRQCILQS